ncbi:phosphonopyruvate decarboxylase [Streptomyces sp. NBC_00320]|uniref:phosphonopyruvate decarboxylase n=1 Tax=Streptomyces sp. NBC_00320 TaxID=2975711 RepID=UPI002258F783|nr:phosphonopyruvate decarboxylase [Streptomyces sp. NBC_00320]MCX5146388.1 phosphonopyruvate decarboxylase [Streptomyces sp. NBC_00320]
MISAEFFCAELDRRGYGFFSGVPCSFLKGPFALLEQRGSYVPAPNEGIALSMAAGAELGGTKAVVLAQNSGLGNLLDPLTSLTMAYEIPLLLFVSLRGWPNAEDDEPHHAAMGAGTIGVLESVGVAHGILDPAEESLGGLLDRAEEARRENRSFVVLVPAKTVGAHPVPAAASDAQMDRREAVSAIAGHLGDALVYSTTGMISRELFGIVDNPRNFYMQGSMGHAIGLGLGTALNRPDQQVVVIDGDGAAVMHLGGLALVGERRPANLTHFVLDNGAYDSTGGQRTRDVAMRWDELALAAGYRTGRVCRTAKEVTAHLAEIEGVPGPHLVALHIGRGGATPARVTSAHTNAEVRVRFQAAAIASRKDDQP